MLTVCIPVIKYIKYIINNNCRLFEINIIFFAIRVIPFERKSCLVLNLQNEVVI